MLQLLYYAFDIDYARDRLFVLEAIIDQGDMHVRTGDDDRARSNASTDADVLKAAGLAKRMIIALAEALARQAARDDDARERNDGGARSSDQRKL